MDGKGGGGGRGGEMTQAWYAHMNNKTIKKRNVMVKSNIVRKIRYTYTCKLHSFLMPNKECGKNRPYT
jgi:hypothetical protein